MVPRNIAVAVGFSMLMAVAGIMTYFASTPRTEVLVGTPVTMDMVPLKSAGSNMPVVYVMEPAQQQSSVLSTPSSATQLAQVQPANLANLPVSVAFPLPNGVVKTVAKPLAAAVAPKHQVVASRSNPTMPVPTAQERRFEAAYPVETEAQAVKRAKILAQQDYLETYQTAIKAENSAEAQERKNRIARAKHAEARAKMFSTLKGQADKKEGWVKLEREMGMIMDGVDGLHYKGYKK